MMKDTLLIIALVVLVVVLLAGWYYYKNDYKNHGGSMTVGGGPDCQPIPTGGYSQSGTFPCPSSVTSRLPASYVGAGTGGKTFVPKGQCINIPASIYAARGSSGGTEGSSALLVGGNWLQLAPDGHSYVVGL